MKAGVDSRIIALRSFLENRTANYDGFLCDDGSIFNTMDAVSYLRQHGAVTPRGKRITRFIRPAGALDPLSASLCEFVDDIIQDGFPLEALEGDEPDVDR